MIVPFSDQAHGLAFLEIQVYGSNEQYWRARGYTADLVQEASADRDIIMFAQAPVFVQGGGGYSGLGALLNTALGHQVLRSKSAFICPQSRRNMLCMNH